MKLASKLALASIFLFLGCKTAENQSGSDLLDATGNARHRILLIGSGGWGSCGSGGNPFEQRIFDSFKTLVADVGKNADVDMIAACLNNVSPSKLVSNLWYGLKDGSVFKIKARDFPFYVGQYIQQTRPTQVYMVGHSYGGWVVLNLAQSGIKSQAIFALDPIDAEYCLPTSNFFLGIGIESSKCKMVPRMDYNKIAATTQRLYQLWQPLGPIHSVPINLPFVVNQQFDINHASFGGLQVEKDTYAHRMIGSEPTAWGVACHTIFKVNKWSPSGCRMVETDGDGVFVRYVTPTVPDLEFANIKIPDPNAIPKTPNRITCTKTPQGPQGIINWRVSVVKGVSGWHIDAKRNNDHLYDEKDTSRVLQQQLTSGGLTNFVHASNTLWLSLKPIATGKYVGQFFTQKYNFKIQDMDCADEG